MLKGLTERLGRGESIKIITKLSLNLKADLKLEIKVES